MRLQFQRSVVLVLGVWDENCVGELELDKEEEER